MARLGFPQNFLIYFDIPDTSDDAVHGNVVSLRRGQRVLVVCTCGKRSAGGE